MTSARAFAALFTITHVCIILAISPLKTKAEIDAQEVVNKGAAAAEKLSGLPLEEQVPGRLLETRGEVIEALWKIFRDEYPEGRFEVLQEVMDKFGFYIDTPDSDEELIALFAEGIAGVYDPDDKTSYVVSRDAREEIEEEMKKRGCRILDYGIDDTDWFDVNRETIVMVHEMTHAIQDQHFDLNAFEEKYKNNTDVAYAYSSLTEGMAEFIEREYIYTERFNYSQRFVYEPQRNLYAALERARESEEGGDDLFDIGRDSCGDMKSYAGLVSFLKYVYGRALVEKAVMESGWKNYEKLFEKFPLSTEQVLHPEKYFEETEDLPMFFGYPDFYETLGEDFEFIDSDSIGEYRLYLLIRDLEISGRDAIEISEGWDGDRYYVFRHPETDEVCLAWITAWDSSNDADEFFKFYRTMARRKEGSADIEPVGSDLYYIETSYDMAAVEKRGNVVVVVEGMQDKEEVDELRELTFGAEMREATRQDEQRLPDWLIVEEEE